jgi:hypothetical protein
MWRGLSAVAAVLLLARILFLNSTPATIQPLTWQMPTESGLGTPATMQILAYSLRPPATSEFSLSLPDGLDAEWPLKWTWKGFSWRGMKWQTTLTVWLHEPNNCQGDILTFLPTGETISFPGLTAALPAELVQPVWTPPAAPLDTPPPLAPIQRRLTAGLLVLAVVAVAAALVRLFISWLGNAPRRNALKHLSDSRQPLTADAIYDILVEFFSARQRTPPSRDLLRLADSLARGSDHEALLAPSLRFLTHSLNRLRFSQQQPQPNEQLASCQRLASFIVRYYC